MYICSGNAQVNLVAAIAFDRFICIARPLSTWKFTKEKVCVIGRRMEAVDRSKFGVWDSCKYLNCKIEAEAEVVEAV